MKNSFSFIFSLFFATISYAQISDRFVPPSDINEEVELDNKINDDSLRLLIEKGEKGDTIVQIFLAKQYYFGIRLNEDNEKAFYWFTKAADLKCKESYYYLGEIYDRAYGVSKDYTKAKYWFGKASELGDFNAMNYLGYYYANGLGVTKDYIKGKYWYEKAANLGNDISMANLGELYEKGLGVTKDYIKAKYWYEKSANLGNSDAMDNIGSLYFNGDGISKDYIKAKYWYEKSAELENSDAMNTLGVLYENGYGVTVDYSKAKYWYEKSAELENSDAIRNLGGLFYSGYGVLQNYETAKYYYEKAIELNDAGAMSCLGTMYAEGKGVEKSYQLAKYWYQKATDNGNSYASILLYLLEDENTVKINGISLERRNEKVKELSFTDFSNGWIYLTETKNDIKLFKEVSKDSYSNVKVWVKSIPKSSQLTSYRNEYSSYFKSATIKQKIVTQLSSFKSLYIIDCSENKLGEKSSVYYTKDGSVIYNDNNELFNEYDMDEVIPETIGEDILKTICEYYEKYGK